ncbi:1-phosphofructokinase family hexose kinase [Edaphobacter bradus]|uniref:1-phosphofructokinase family hexose kinase n=1 Tax=Edaphobacter bradus TaxID=2259016 RepID=UPI0021DF5B07|nr:1-phosphofructokinase family hexose kinase [Edaphobacter bradus]
MFICISPNPAIDKRLRVPNLTLGAVNRAIEASPAPGGKAAHVAMTLRTLKADPLWLGFVGGHSGEMLLDGLKKLGIDVHAIPIQQPTRINLEIIADDGTVTEILEPGPAVSVAEVKSLQGACDLIFAKGKERAHVVLSGSLPPGVDNGFYATLIRQAQAASCKVLLDTSGAPLRKALEHGLDFVKPNRDEAEWLIGAAISCVRSGADAVRYLLAKGAKSAAVSLGREGLVWCPAKDAPVYYATPPVIAMRSAVGSGDAVVAAFAYSMSLGLAPEETIRIAAACGAANCLAESPGLLNAADVSRLRDEVRVTII